MSAKSISQKRLKELLHYDPETGVFTWRSYRSVNAKAGSIAGGLCKTHGYILIHIGGRRSIGGRQYFAHRLAFLYMTGEFPINHTDHINHIKDDNRWANLREATQQTNNKNRPMQENNKSGHTGVYWYKSSGKWRSQINIDGKHIHLGCFTEKADAILARKTAEVKYGYHQNHGDVL